MSKGYCYLQEEAKFKMAVGDVDAWQNCIDDALQSFDRAHELLTKVMDRGYIASIENLVERYIYWCVSNSRVLILFPVAVKMPRILYRMQANCYPWKRDHAVSGRSSQIDCGNVNHAF